MGNEWFYKQIISETKRREWCMRLARRRAASDSEYLRSTVCTWAKMARTHNRQIMWANRMLKQVFDER